MTENNIKKMNTKFVGHHVSSGGFIFYKNPQNDELYILLIKNKKGEWWIPKGHIEENEDHVTAAFREIEEEVGLKREQLKYVDLCHLYEFSFIDEQGHSNTKEIYMNVFMATDVHDLIMEQNNTTDIRDVAWLPYDKGLEMIMSFSKNELVKAKEIYELFLNKHKIV